MEILVPVVLTLTFCLLASGQPCGASSHCASSSCGRCDSSCCTRNRSPCCTENDSSCNNDKCCCSSPSATSTTLPPRQPEPIDDNIIPIPIPTIAPIAPHNSYSNSTTINNNNNTITIPTNIDIQNEIRSETHITVPVKIDVNNVNTINIRQESETTSALGGTNPICNDTSSPPEPCNNTIKEVTVTVRVPYPVPVYQTISIPYTPNIPRPAAAPTGCCQVIAPCTPYTYCGCQTSSFDCSGHCMDPYVYQHRNVCRTGCYRRDFSMGTNCGQSGCSRGQVDCSRCNENFYASYDTFMMCSGCFVPMPWGWNKEG